MWWSLGWVVKQSSGGRRPGAWVWASRAGFHFWKYCNWTIGIIRNICGMHKSSIQANMFMVLIPSQLSSTQLLSFSQSRSPCCSFCHFQLLCLSQWTWTLADSCSSCLPRRMPGPACPSSDELCVGGCHIHDFLLVSLHFSGLWAGLAV